MKRVSSDDPRRKQSSKSSNNNSKSSSKQPPPADAVQMKRTSSERTSRSATTPNTTKTPARPRPTRSHSLSALYPATPISSYYALNLEILHAFDSLYLQKKYEVAYAMGLQFIETALLEIPRHGYFYASRHEKDRIKSSKEAERVCKLLEEMVDKDAKEERKRLEKLQTLARQQRLQTKPTEYVVDEEYWGDLSICSDTIQHYLCPIKEDSASPALEPLKTDKEKVPPRKTKDKEKVPPRNKLQRRRSKREKEVKPAVKSLTLDEAPAVVRSVDRNVMFEPMEQRVDKETTARPPMFEPLKVDKEARPTTTAALAMTEMEKKQAIETEPKLAASSSPEPMDVDDDSSSYYYQDSLSASESADLERALFLSGLDVRQPSSSSLQGRHGPPTKAPGELDVATLKICFQEDFVDLLNTGRVRISRISTHQGRLVGSINGCTVIAPLLCIHHFSNELDDPNWPDPGLPDAVLEMVMDEETCGLLPQVREKLGLTKDALIIPSDVHDFFMDRGLLMQQQFVTVCGGNILNEGHLNEMVNAIEHLPRQFASKKVAATVFFHEHVVAILKLDRGNGHTWYDLIDSLPLEDTLNAAAAQTVNAFTTPNPAYENWYEEEYSPPYAARIRCLDVDALRATLRWFAISKFSEQDCSYIDSYAWEDDKSDFDPRVFQAFVWSEA